MKNYFTCFKNKLVPGGHRPLGLVLMVSLAYVKKPMPDHWCHQSDVWVAYRAYSNADVKVILHGKVG